MEPVGVVHAHNVSPVGLAQCPYCWNTHLVWQKVSHDLRRGRGASRRVAVRAKVCVQCGARFIAPSTLARAAA